MRIKKITRKALLTHFFFISLFLILPTLAFVRLPGESVFTLNEVIVRDAIANFILLCFFYLNYYVLIPKFYFTRKYVLYVLFVILFLCITFPLPHFFSELVHVPDSGFPQLMPNKISGFPHHPPNNHPPLLFFSFDEFRRHLYLFFTAIFFSFLLKMRERLSKLQEEKLNAELASLKSQINPHFLFNTLNNIYSLSIKKDDRVSNAIIHLSGIMRYAITDAHDAKIPLEKEVDYISHYIELQKSRLGNTASVIYECSGDAADKEIAPLLLITYIENAFKYGVNPDAENCTVKIILHLTDAGIELHTFNKKVKLSGRQPSTGIGINNTRERLQHLYPNKHYLQISENNETYSVTLSLQLI